MGVKRDLILVVTMSFVALMTPTVALADTIDRTDRAAVRTAYEQSYQSIVDRLTFPESPWTGSVTECDAGTVPSSVRDGLMAGVNFFRALAGVDAGTRDPAADTKVQAAALVMHANEELSHEPPPTGHAINSRASLARRWTRTMLAQRPHLCRVALTQPSMSASTHTGQPV